MSDTPHAPDMLEPAQWDRLRGLTLTPRALVEGRLPGHHAAKRTGAGSEFHDYRPYVPGDDLARVDWKVFGRSDRYYLRRHQHETDLTAHILIDASPSMDFAGLDAHGRALANHQAPTKLRRALELAMALTVIAVQQGDRAGVAVYDRALRETIDPAGTWRHARHIRDVLAALQPGHAPADPRAALEALHRRSPRRSLVIVISDFLDEPEGFFAGADRLRRAGAELVALTLLTSTELTLAPLSDATAPLRLIDPETRQHVTAHGSTIAHRYRQCLQAHLDRLRQGCAARQLGHHLLTTHQPIAPTLRRLLAPPT